MCGFVQNETSKTDRNNPPIKRKVLLYSRASLLHVQIKKTELDARGREGSEYGKRKDMICYRKIKVIGFGLSECQA